MNQPKPIRFQMIGGFLGAGKTTTIAQIARSYVKAGLGVGIVTNDQADDLVDTATLKSQGFQVGEVAGACFCCHFDDLISTIRSLSIEQLPDVILAEPVGSCTDLVATVIEPLRRFYQGEFLVNPYVVLAKPEHGLKILAGERCGFSPQAEYIFVKQLEEADIVVINKVDKLSDRQLTVLKQAIGERFPEKQLLTISAKHGLGIDRLIQAFNGVIVPADDFIEVDYDIYAAGESQLGWLNATYAIDSKSPVALDQLVEHLVHDLGERITSADAEIAHLKILARIHDACSVANLVSSNSEVELSVSSGVSASACQVILNARIAIDPKQLAALVQSSVASVSHRLGCRAMRISQEALRPGRPVPTHSLR
jgi:Ni2+-binding GTPase involved in maturation of urease and hydrogenase